MKLRRPETRYRCSFCGKSQEQVRRLIAGPGGVYICNECVALCNDIIAKEEAAERPRYPRPGEIYDEISLLITGPWFSGGSWRGRCTLDIR